MYTQESIHQIVEKQREFFKTGKTLDLSWRLAQLKKLKKAILDNEEVFEKALYEDLGRSKLEAYLCDMGPIIVEINESIVFRIFDFSRNK